MQNTKNIFPLINPAIEKKEWWKILGFKACEKQGCDRQAKVGEWCYECAEELQALLESSYGD